HAFPFDLSRARAPDVGLERVERAGELVEEAERARDAQHDVQPYRRVAALQAPQRAASNASTFGDLLPRQVQHAPPRGKVPSHLLGGTPDLGGQNEMCAGRYVRHTEHYGTYRSTSRT